MLTPDEAAEVMRSHGAECIMSSPLRRVPGAFALFFARGDARHCWLISRSTRPEILADEARRKFGSVRRLPEPHQVESLGEVFNRLFNRGLDGYRDGACKAGKRPV